MTSAHMSDSEVLQRIDAVQGKADVTYQCLRNAAAAWGWRVVSTG